MQAGVGGVSLKKINKRAPTTATANYTIISMGN